MSYNDFKSDFSTGNIYMGKIAPKTIILTQEIYPLTVSYLLYPELESRKRTDFDMQTKVKRRLFI